MESTNQLARNSQASLHFKRLGEGFPVVILHGLFGSSNNWMSIGRALADSYSVFLVDQRNHGRSFHSDRHSFRLMAEDLRNLLQQEGLDRIHLLGHSMGGKTAMTFALRYQDLVRKLVVVDIAPRPYPPGHDTILESLCRLDLKTIHSRQEAEQRLAADIPELRVRQFLLTNLRRDNQGRFEWKMNLKSLRRNYSEITKGVVADLASPVPALFVRGERSNYMSQKDLAGIRRLFLNAELETISGAGHWVHADSPERFLAAVTNFLA